MKIYGVEYEPQGLLGIDKYRFVSLYNGAKGPWRVYRDSAESDGKTHQKLIESLHADKLVKEEAMQN